MPSYSALRFVSAWTKKQFISVLHIIPIYHVSNKACTWLLQSQKKSMFHFRDASSFLSLFLPFLWRKAFLGDMGRNTEGLWKNLFYFSYASCSIMDHKEAHWGHGCQGLNDQYMWMRWGMHFVGVHMDGLGHPLSWGPLHVMGPDSCSSLGMCVVWPQHCCLYWENAKM